MLSYAYDKDGTQVSVTSSTTDGEGNTNVTHYTAGLVTRVESGNHVVDYVYDGKRRLTAVKLDGNVHEEYSYVENVDEKGNDLIITRYSNGNPDVYVYKNKRGDVVEHSLDSMMSSVKYYYKDDGRIERITDSYESREKAFGYDGEKRLTNYTDTNGLTETLTYDDRDRIETRNETVELDLYQEALFGTTQASYTYTYDADNPARIASLLVNGTTVTPTYDALGRSTGKKISIGTSVKASEEISYLKHGDHTTSLPAVMKFKTAQGEERIKYSYDAMGNIVKISEDGIVASRYEYDALGRLTREDNRAFDKTSLWEYDENGNILSRREYAFTVKTTEELTEIEPVDVVEYKYDGDRLISYNGNRQFAYNADGNPTKYNGKTVTWTSGKRLQSYNGVYIGYDGDTLPKHINGLWFAYDRSGNIVADSDFHYLYDHNGALFGCKTRVDDWGEGSSVTYYYRRDALGNIVAILDTDARVVVNYKYNAWGKCKVLNPDGTENTDASFIGNRNPFRYRGYYYEKQTNLYFLKARFYDPEVGRFISADTIDYLAPDTINGLNLYAYCGNNPIMNVDPSGHWSWKTFWVGVGLVVTAAAAIAVSIATFGAATPVAVSVLAGITLAAGILTGINGIATIIEAGTEYNFVRDGLFNEVLGLSDTAYNVYAGITEGIAAIGTAACTIWNITTPIKGFTIHGKESALFHDGHGVNASAMQNAVRHPSKVVQQSNGGIKYIGKNAVVVLNKAGKVITTYAKNHHGWRGLLALWLGSVLFQKRSN